MSLVVLQPPTPFKSPHDLDAWCISLYPKDLLQLCKPVSPIQLVNHAPSIRDHPTFQNWVSVGNSIFNIKIDPKFKKPLLDILIAADIILFTSDYPEALIRGNQVITAQVFIRCLEKAGVDTIRVQGYGMKMYTRTPYDGPNLGNPDHPMADLNTFDLGINYADGNMTLVSPRHHGIPGMQAYTILTPISKGFGGVQVPVKYRGSTYKVKVYPRIVHQIKAQAGNHMLTKPKSVMMCRKRKATLLGHLKEMANLRASQLGGLRVEATITSPTLHLAIMNISTTPVLNLDQYINPTLEEMQPYKLRSMMVSKQMYINNLKMLLAKAEEQEVFVGRNTSPAHPDSQQIIVDLFNALGWNMGRFEPTKWNDPSPWWDHSPGTADTQAVQAVQQIGSIPDSLATLGRVQGVEAFLKLFTSIRDQVPCPTCKSPPPILFNQGGKKQFRLECRGCKARLNQEQAKKYFSMLMDKKVITINLADHGLDKPAPQAAPAPPTFSSDEEQEDVPMPDLGDSSGSEQADVHPVTGDRRKSNRLSKRAVQQALQLEAPPVLLPVRMAQTVGRAVPLSNPLESEEEEEVDMLEDSSEDEGVVDMEPASNQSTSPVQEGEEEADQSLPSQGPELVISLPYRARSPVFYGPLSRKEDEMVRSVLEELELALGLSPAPQQPSSEPIPVLQEPAQESISVPQQPSASPAAPVRLPSSQQLLQKPNLWHLEGLPPAQIIIRRLYNVKISLVIQGDGNCMFRAMSYHLYGDQDSHMAVRQAAIAWLQANLDTLHAFAAQGDGHFSAEQYLSRMSKYGEWGDEIMLMAIAQAHNVSIMVQAGLDESVGEFIGTIYPHDAPGPHCGLMFLAVNQHYQLMYY